MTVVTYASDFLHDARHVLAVVVGGRIVCRPKALGLDDVPGMASVYYARDVLNGLRELKSPDEIPNFVRWQGLCIAIFDEPEHPVEEVFATPLPPRYPRQKPVRRPRATARRHAA